MSSGPAIPGYRDLRPIGSGAFADVYAAEDETLRRAVAIKILRQRTPSLTQVDRFRREREVLAGLSHPHLLRVHRAGSAKGRLFVVMELLPGGTLADRLSAGLPRAEGVDLVLQAADGVAALHRAGLVHRDVKPTNLLLDAHGRVKVADLGLVAGADLDTLTKSKELTGTPAYLAPELFRGGSQRAPTSDVYSLGVLLFEVLTGEPPHSGENVLALLHARHAEPDPDPARRVANLPGPLVAVCRQAMAGDPAKRFPDAGAFAEALRAAVAGRAPLSAPGALSVLAALALAALGIAGGWALRAGEPPPPQPAVENETPVELSPGPVAWPDPEALAAKLLDGDAPARRVAARWIAAHPAEAELVARLRVAGRLGALRAPPLRRLAMRREHRAHQAHGLAWDRERVTWIELCHPTCTARHRGSTALVEFVGADPQDLTWPGGRVTAVADDLTCFAASSLGSSSVVYRLLPGRVEVLAELPWARTTAVRAQGTRLFAGSAEGEVLALDLDTGQVLWRRAAHQDRAVGFAVRGTALLSASNEGPTSVRRLSLADGSELPWAYELPPLGPAKWTLDLRDPSEWIVCLDVTNLVHGLRHDGSRSFSGTRDLDPDPLMMTGQWSPDSTVGARAGVSCGDLLLLFGSRWTDAGLYSQARAFRRDDAREVFAVDRYGVGYYTANLGETGVLTLGGKTERDLVVEVRELELPDPR